MKEREELICNDDFSFEMLHYLNNGYKVKKCKICEKLFYTLNDKVKYCHRVGQNERYPHLNCEDTAQRIRKNNWANNELRRRHSVLSSTIDRLINEKGYDEQIKKDFLQESRIIRTTKTDEEYDKWLCEQEQKYMKRKYKTIY